MNDIPSQVMNAASVLREMYGEHVEYLGEFQGAQAYYYHYPDDVSVGFPSVYLLKDDEMTEIGVFFALEILESFIEDVDEASVE